MEKNIKRTGLAVFIILLLASGAMGSIGVIQDYMEDNRVLAPRGETTCHRIWLSTSPSVEHGQAKLVLDEEKLPDFVDAYLEPTGIYDTTKGSSEAVIFSITPPEDAEPGEEYPITFVVEGMESPGEGMVTLTGKISSKFIIKIAESDIEVPDRCGQLPQTVNLPPECGDGECNGQETCDDCPEDCGECPVEESDSAPEGPAIKTGGDNTILIIVVLLTALIVGLFLLRVWNLKKRR